MNQVIQKRILYFILSILFFASYEVFAVQTILLRNGGKIRGDVVGQNEKSIQIVTEEGKKMTLSKRTILKVIYKEITTEEEKKIRQEEEKKIQEKPPETKEEVKEEPIFIPPPTTTSGRSRWSIVKRSAALPGWGHVHADRKITGYTYAGIFGLSIVGAAVTYNQAQHAKSEYDSRVMQSLVFFGPSPVGFGRFYTEGKRSAYKESVTRANNAIALIGVVYLTQLIHAYFTGMAWEKEEVVFNQEGLALKKGWQFFPSFDLPSTELKGSSALSSNGVRAELRFNTLY
ncbi:hypothetical protein CH373_05920 [Leptospira perolatii]|uniref:DUF5683 domain-containing protein n=1 Tax=Leptospira perolatii TaxID=2023191 RepID=A0A2M9ZR35_9LEPT|nr:hypothetical protein [Leptospira perolatii]PJZ68373.1 hypothetical protein CH360_16485 [Leptospira perolatii]PJZ74431.1 hypothetical protein CH373_05920 [Leptospira perolatii]